LLPVLCARYGFTDDYSMLYGALTDPARNAWFLVGTGRPIGALLLWSAFGMVHSIDGLVLLRGVGVAGAALAAGTLTHAAQRLRYHPAVALLMGIGLVALPSTVFAASWG